ncbi:16669_t:CDS:2 [Dentiscutata erythropus]|uniref:16669_t:CDS:1 n=1 Tax=Dentiscutata erythropus TaxID=1348616 RepID=A0A9N9HHI1_9GLOM|nr:16669_t:CDS:2 [Dentiscutata erythropus]
MPRRKLTGPCAVTNCNNSVKSYRNVTQDLKTKIDLYFDSQYNYLKVNQDQICFEHYMNIVNFVAFANQISENTTPRTFIDLGDIIEYSKISLNNSNSNTLIDYLKLYEEHQYIDLDPNNFSNIKVKIVNNGIFIDRSNFNELINIIINQNIQNNNNDLIQISGITINSKTLYNYREKIKDNYLIKINEYFASHLNNFHCFNIDDFHDIQILRQPNTTTFSTANHLATCIY